MKLKRKNTKKTKLIKLFAVITVISAISYAAVSTFHQKNHDPVIAKINKQKIYKSEITKKISETFIREAKNNIPQIENLPPEIIETFAKEIYFEKELTSVAKSEITKKDALQNKVRDAENKAIRDTYLDFIMTERVSDDRVKDKYIELVNELAGKKEYSISHIVFNNENDANKIWKELQNQKSKKTSNGKSVSNVGKFSELAKKYSIDKESTPNGGDLGYILENNLINEISTAVVNMTKDQISKPIKTKFGWHIIKINDVRDAKPMPFEEVKQNIKERLIKEETEEIYTKILGNGKVQILIKNNPKNTG
jgi:peptidyl-prolyl cis-trans isomerase C